MIATRCIAPLAIVACLAVSIVAASDELTRAKDLYRSAAYDEALVALERVASESTGDIRTEANEYRLFCLIALDRKVDARVAIETMVSNDPFYQISSQASPRVRAMFKDLRQSLLPGLVQREYATAKASFDREDPEAAGQFDRVLKLLEDPLLSPTPALADLKTVASGFRDLSKARGKKPEATPAPAAQVSPSLTANNAPAPDPVAGTAAVGSAATQARPTPTVYREGEPGVVPPVATLQQVPQWNVPIGTRPGAWQPEAALELTIDESGSVTNVVLRKSFHPTYDPLLVKAAQSWTYQPARKDGVPVRFVKYVIVRLGNVN